MYMLLHKPHLVKWSTKGGKGSKMSKKMSTWFMTQIIAFRDVTAKFYDMGLITLNLFVLSFILVFGRYFFGPFRNFAL